MGIKISWKGSRRGKLNYAFELRPGSYFRMLGRLMAALRRHGGGEARPSGREARPSSTAWTRSSSTSAAKTQPRKARVPGVLIQVWFSTTRWSKRQQLYMDYLATQLSREEPCHLRMQNQGVGKGGHSLGPRFKKIRIFKIPSWSLLNLMHGNNFFENNN